MKQSLWSRLVTAISFLVAAFPLVILTGFDYLVLANTHLTQATALGAFGVVGLLALYATLLVRDAWRRPLFFIGATAQFGMFCAPQIQIWMRYGMLDFFGFIISAAITLVCVGALRPRLVYCRLQS